MEQKLEKRAIITKDGVGFMFTYDQVHSKLLQYSLPSRTLTHKMARFWIGRVFWIPRKETDAVLDKLIKLGKLKRNNKQELEVMR